MNNFFILGIAIAGIEMVYQKLMFPNMPLEWWFMTLYRLKDKGKFYRYLSFILGYCHFCNSVWLAMIIHLASFGLSWSIFITVGVSFFALCVISSNSGLIYINNKR